MTRADLARQFAEQLKDEGYVTVDQAATRLGIPAATVGAWITKKKIRTRVRVGRSYWVPLSEVLAYAKGYEQRKEWSAAFKAGKPPSPPTPLNPSSPLPTSVMATAVPPVAPSNGHTPTPADAVRADSFLKVARAAFAGELQRALIPHEDFINLLAATVRDAIREGIREALSTPTYKLEEPPDAPA